MMFERREGGYGDREGGGGGGYGGGERREPMRRSDPEKTVFIDNVNNEAT